MTAVCLQEMKYETKKEGKKGRNGSSTKDECEEGQMTGRKRIKNDSIRFVDLSRSCAEMRMGRH